MKIKTLFLMLPFFMGFNFVQAQGDKLSFYAEVYQACPDTEQEPSSNCLTLIERLENSSNINDMMKLTEAYSSLKLSTRDVERKRRWHKKRIVIYNKILAIDSKNTKALLGLTIGAPRAESLRLLRKIIEIDPANDFVLQSIAKELHTDGIIVRLEGEFYPERPKSQEEVDRSEARGYLLQGYQLVKDDNTRYRFALMLYQAHLAVNQSEQAASFRARVMGDIDITPEPANYQTALHQLHLSCNYSLIQLAMTEVCLNSIRQVFYSGNPSTKRLIKDAPKLIKAIDRLKAYLPQLQKQFPDVQLEIRNILEEIKALGHESLDFYMVYYFFVSDQQKIAVLRQAVTFEKDGEPGLATSWLASRLVKAGQYEDARALLQKLVTHGEDPYKRKAKRSLQTLSEKKDKLH